MKVLCHRGIDFDRDSQESSKSSFEQALKVCDGLEIDLQLSKDNRLFVWHDQVAERLTQGRLKSDFSSYDLPEIQKNVASEYSLMEWSELKVLMNKYPDKIYALHIKGPNQQSRFLSAFQEALTEVQNLFSSILVFDLKIETAKQISKNFPNLPLAISVSEIVDIQRYNSFTSETLYSTEEAKRNSDIFSWAWLDEWDLKGKTPESRLYTNHKIEEFKSRGFNVAIVSPELHAKSPGLLGGEAHEEGNDLNKLEDLWKRLSDTQADAICTDYSQRLTNLRDSN